MRGEWETASLREVVERETRAKAEGRAAAKKVRNGNSDANPFE